MRTEAKCSRTTEKNATGIRSQNAKKIIKYRAVICSYLIQQAGFVSI